MRGARGEMWLWGPGSRDEQASHKVPQLRRDPQPPAPWRPRGSGDHLLGARREGAGFFFLLRTWLSRSTWCSCKTENKLPGERAGQPVLLSPGGEPSARALPLLIAAGLTAAQGSRLPATPGAHETETGLNHR